MDLTYSDEETFDEQILNVNPVTLPPNKSTLNRGIIKDDLCIEVPQKPRKLTETGLHGGPSSVSAANRLRDMLQPRSAYVSSLYKISYNL